ncbi:MAG: PQQ-like beta-propeller repeat protein [Verrucomicrobiales bacterium]|nr:PQQ-like beta-propeller repeat protein [Verrucomicrobiales bacterium]MCP5558728.1 PQQ-like beta-propeller repeat protein [Verrucomicrobiaceae bacterium]
MKINAVSLFALLGLCGQGITLAEDWPQFRGPDRTGISSETDWQGDGSKVLWQAEVGLGFSSFVVDDGRVVTAGHADDEDTVFCFDAIKGTPIWKHSYPADLGGKYFEGGTCGTPTLDDGKVYHLSRWGDVFCFDAASGKVLWSKNVQKETGIRIPDWGYAGAPLVSGDLIILNVGKAGVALRKATGEIAWKSEDDNAGYSTPYPIKVGGADLVVLGSGESFIAVEPASGKQAWAIGWPTRYGVNAADPILHGDELFISTGYGRGCGLFKVGSAGPELIWQNKELRNQFSSSVLIDGALYGIDDDENKKASLKCIDWQTGALKWKEQSFGFGALTSAAGKLIIITAKGELVMAKAAPDSYDELSRVQVLSGKCWTAPVLANGLLYCRNSEGSVVCLDLRK